MRYVFGFMTGVLATFALFVLGYISDKETGKCSFCGRAHV